MNPFLKILQDNFGKVPPHNPSGTSGWLAGKIIAAEAGSITMEYVIRPEMLNVMKKLHGGITATILDDIMGGTTMTLSDDFMYMTISLSVDYFYPASLNDVIVAKSFVVKDGKQIKHLQAELHHKESGKMIAKATSNLFLTHIEAVIKK